MTSARRFAALATAGLGAILLSIVPGGQRTAFAQAVPGPASAHVSRHVVGGVGGWDYLEADPAGKRLFLSRGDRVDVVDLASMQVTQSIAATAGVHGIALAPDRQLGYTSNGRAGSVTVFELGTLRTVDEIKGVGDNPDAIVYDSGSGRVFAFGGRSHDAVVIDAASRRVTGSIPLPGKPEFAVVDGRGSVFVNIEDRHSLIRIDAAAMKVTADWPLNGCEEPTGLAIDGGHHRLFSVCANHVMKVIDADMGALVATVPIGTGPDAVAFDRGAGLVLSSNGEGTLTVIRQLDPDRYAVAGTVVTQRGARTMALDETTHRVYLVSSEFAPAAASAASPRPVQVPGTFAVLTVDLTAWLR